MKRAVAAFAVLAATAAVMSQGTFSDYATTRSNSGGATTASSFLPVNLSAPSVSGTVGLNNVLSLTQGTWGYAGATGGTVDSTGRQAITATNDQWQYCISGVCANLSGQNGATLTINATIVTAVGGLLTGVTFRVAETATNASGTSSATNSNAVS